METNSMLCVSSYFILFVCYLHGRIVNFWQIIFFCFYTHVYMSVYPVAYIFI